MQHRSLIWKDLSQEAKRFLDKRKQAKMRWLQDLNHSNVDNLKNVRREADMFQEQKGGISES